MKKIIFAAAIIPLILNVSCQWKEGTKPPVQSGLIGQAINMADNPATVSIVEDGKEQKYQLYANGSYAKGHCYIEEISDSNTNPIVALTNDEYIITDTMQVSGLNVGEYLSFGTLLFNGKDYIDNYDDPDLYKNMKYGLVRYDSYTGKISQAWLADNETMKFTPIEVTPNLRLMDDDPGCDPDQDM